MSVVIKISYEQQEELDRVLKLLRPIITSYKVSSNNNGVYKKAYAYIKDSDKVKLMF